MFVRDLQGDEYPCQATVTIEKELNGNQSLTVHLVPTKTNDLFIESISEMWDFIDDDETVYKIVYCRKKGQGTRMIVDVKGLPTFFDDFDNDRIYETYNQHMTAFACFTIIFSGSGYEFVLLDSFPAADWQGFGQRDTRLENFKRAINRYGCEFKVIGNTVYLAAQIGNDTAIRYEHRLNASNITQEIDASGFWTYAKGFGDFAEGEEDNAALVREYTSPLAAIPSIGLRHAPPITNGNITLAETMDEQLKKLVDESLVISATADIIDLSRQKYPIAQAELGDRVFLIDPRIKFEEEVRIVKIKTSRNWIGEIVDLEIVFGAPKLVQRQKSNLNTALQQIDDILKGRVTLPSSVLPETVRIASEAINNSLTEIQYPPGQGIVLQDPANPNRLVRLTSEGIGLSDDGGATYRTAMTGVGIVADEVVTGILRANNVTIVGEDDLFFWDGTGLFAYSSGDPSRYVRLTSAGLYIAKGAITIERPDGYPIVNNGLSVYDVNIQSHDPPFNSSQVEHVGYFWRTKSENVQDCNFYTFEHKSRYLKVNLTFYAQAGGTCTVTVEKGAVGFGNNQVLATVSTTSTDPLNTTTVTVDLGVPTGNRESFYIRVKTSNAAYFAYVRSARRWLEG